MPSRDQPLPHLSHSPPAVVGFGGGLATALQAPGPAPEILTSESLHPCGALYLGSALLTVLHAEKSSYFTLDYRLPPVLPSSHSFILFFNSPSLLIHSFTHFIYTFWASSTHSLTQLLPGTRGARGPQTALRSECTVRCERQGLLPNGQIPVQTEHAPCIKSGINFKTVTVAH